MPIGRRSLLQTLTIINDNWVYLTWLDRLEIIWRVASKRFAKMSRRRKAFVIAAGGLVVGFFFVLLALSAGVASPEFRDAMYAFVLGLLIGSVVVYFALTR